MTSVSVIIPTYNRAHVLPRALASVRAQTHAVTEIIVVDDGSADDSAALVAREFPEAFVISQPNHGVSHARNRGIDAASGDWLAFLDSDDEWCRDKLERQLAALALEPETRVCHTDEMWIRRGRRVNPCNRHHKQGGWIFHRCLPLCVISPSAVLLRRDVLEDLGGFDETLPACEDYDLWLRLSAAEPVLYIPEVLTVKHGGHADQLSHRYWGMDRFRIRALEKLVHSRALTPPHLRSALEEILRKIAIYLAGARKRQKAVEVAAYERKQRYYGRLLARAWPSLPRELGA